MPSFGSISNSAVTDPAFPATVMRDSNLPIEHQTTCLRNVNSPIENKVTRLRDTNIPIE